MSQMICCVVLLGLAGQPAEKPVVAQALPANLEKHWSDLADRDKTRAALAMLALAASPREATAFLKERLKPVKIDANKVAKWLSELDSDDFQTHSRALENLEYCGKYIRSDLEKALKSTFKIETKHRIERLQAKLPLVLKLPPGFGIATSSGSLSVKVSSDLNGNNTIFINNEAIDWPKSLSASQHFWLRAQRAIAVLEHFGTPDARQLLQSLAAGEEEALPTVAAQTALGRLRGVLEYEKLWAELANPDEELANRVMLALAAKPKETIALFKERLKPVRADAKHVANLLSQLDSNRYAVRNQALQDLEYCGPLMRNDLEEAIRRAPSLETKRRIENLQAKLPRILSARENGGGVGTSTQGIELSVNWGRTGKFYVTINGSRIPYEQPLGPPQVLWIRAARAVTILEHFGNGEARQLLRHIADGEADTGPTIDARVALWRLSLTEPQETAQAPPSEPIKPTPQQLQAAIKAFAKIGGQFAEYTDWKTKQPFYTASLPPLATDDDLKKLPFVPFSFGLSLSGQEKITNAGMAKLASIKNLRDLSLWSTKVTDAGLKELADLQSLCSLDLSFTKVTNVRMLAGLKNLSSLDLHNTLVAGSGLRELFSLRRLSSLGLSSTDVDDADLREVAKLQSLTSLNLGHTGMITDDGVRELIALRNLTELHVGQTGLTDACLGDIARFTKLAHLDLYGTAITGRGLAHLAKLEHLAHLCVASAKLTDDGVKQIAAIKSLKSLDLRYLQVTFAGLKELANLKELSSLSLTGAKVTDAELKAIAKCSNLTELDISEAKVTDEGMKALAALDKLSSLDLTSCNVTCEGVVGAKGFPSLTKLNLYSSSVTDAGLGEIVKLKKLTTLNLDDTKITNAGLKGIDNLANLQTLTISGCEVNDEGLQHIARLPHLKELNLHKANVTDAGVKEFVKLKELSSLGLDNSKLTDAGLRELGKLRKLESLWFLGAMVNDEVFRELQKALPGCYISRPE